MMNVLLADDEPIARQGMRRLVEQVPFFRLAGVAKNVSEVRLSMKTVKIDLLLLDIQMPGMSGLDFVKTLTDPPLLIFTTAFAGYAMEGYEVNALDYLLKPISQQRFIKAANKAREHFEVHQNLLSRKDFPAEKDHIFIKENRQWKKIYLEEILFIEAMLNYVIIHTGLEKIITYTSMKSLLATLPPTRFLKIHKSYIVAIDKVSVFGGNSLGIGDRQLPVSKSHRNELKRSIG
jgi:DNA-binding LytR/AlgR family response regulator